MDTTSGCAEASDGAEGLEGRHTMKGSWLAPPAPAANPTGGPSMPLLVCPGVRPSPMNKVQSVSGSIGVVPPADRSPVGTQRGRQVKRC